MIPLWSLITLGTEICITACVFTIIYRAYYNGVFLKWFAFGVLAYELLFNVSYMASRELGAIQDPASLDPYLTALAIFHGIFSLLMFALLVAFFLFAYRRYERGENFFATHKKITVSFLIAWSASILSGIALFVELYLF